MIYNKIALIGMQSDVGLATLLTNVSAGNGAGTGSGVIYLFNGVPPTDPDAAIDVTNGTGAYTLLGKIVSNTTGPVGLSFADNSTSVVLSKHASETWSTGTIGTFVGGLNASSSAPITFIRFCAIADDGHTLNTTHARVQATVAQTGSGVAADILLANNVVTVGGTFGFDGFAFV